MLVDVEYTNCKNNQLKRLIKNAELEQPDVSIATIDYTFGHKLNKALMGRLVTCEYITDYRYRFIIIGNTGSGKTYMVCADGNFGTVLKKYANPVLLIIDEWLFLKLTKAEARDGFELIHKRCKHESMTF